MPSRFFAAVLSAGLALAQRGEFSGALIASLSGPAKWTSARGAGAAARAYDWLEAGTTLETGPGARVVLAFAQGPQFELGPEARLVIAAQGPREARGPVRALASTPPMPKLPGIAPGERASARAGAIRVRGGTSIEGLYPRDGFTVLAERAVLRFSGVANAAPYRVSIEDAAGRVVFDQETGSTELAVPAGRLEPGVRYGWRVRTATANGMPLRGQAEFSTVGQEEAAARKVWRAATPDAGVRAALDRRLGLVLEAREEVRLLEQTPEVQGWLAELDGLISGSRR